MEGIIYLGSTAASLVYFVLGVRLVRLGIRTRSASEWLLGLTFLAWTGSYAPWAIAIALQDQLALESQILIISRIATNLGGIGGVDPLTNAWWWFEWIGTIAPSVWIGAEGLHHYGTSRQRIRLGLCEPIVGHRYLLWGIAGVFWILLDIVIVGQYVEFWATQSWSTTLDNLTGFFEIAALAMIWLAFFTPAAYQRRIDNSAVSS
jgi:hypothetical protein